MTNITKNDITGVILAGGQARRMGGIDKGLIELDNVPMIEIIINKFTPQVGSLIINANRNQETYTNYGYPVIPDELSGFCGPLAGFASSLKVTETPYMVTTPCDSPFIPTDMVKRLSDKLSQSDADICVADSGERIQPVFSLMKTSLLPSLLAYLDQGERKIDRWFEQHKMVKADFSDVPDAFENINTPEEVEQAENKLKT